MIAVHHFLRFAVLFSITNVCLSFSVDAPNNLTCQESGVQCVGNNTFTVCINFGTCTMLATNILSCPKGYICDDTSTTPCVDKSATTIEQTTLTSINTQSTTEATETTTVVTSDVTTKRVVARPTSAPNCTSTGTYPAPACNQYYVCEQKSILWVYKYYEAVLYTCEDGDYFDTGTSTCIAAALSDCVE